VLAARGVATCAPTGHSSAFGLRFAVSPSPGLPAPDAGARAADHGRLCRAGLSGARPGRLGRPPERPPASDTRSPRPRDILLSRPRDIRLAGGGGNRLARGAGNRLAGGEHA
jgi:hypothetical protein